MAGVNFAILVGNLGRDPEFYALPSGADCARFSVATSEAWTDKNSGERKERTEWHNIVVFREGLVDVVRRFLKKGTRVYIRGTIRTRKWTDDKGTERWSTEVHLAGFGDDLVLLGDASGGARRDGPPPESDGYAGRHAGAGQGAGGGGFGGGRQLAPTDLDDEIPF